MSSSFVDRLQEVLKPWLPPPMEYKPSKLNGATAPASSGRMRAYAEAALEGERRKLAAMPPESGRNWELYLAGCRLGRHVHHGVLSLDEVESALLGDACRSNGLIGEDGLKACADSLASGLRKAEGDELPHLEDRAPHGADAQHSGADVQVDPGTEVGSQQKTGGVGRPTQAQVLIEIATGPDVDLFHAPDGTTYADIRIKGHRETWATKSSGFRRWLRRAYYEKTGSAPNGEAISTALALVEARAQFDGVQRDVHLRIAAHGGLIYIDVGDDTHRAIEIDADGWRIISDPAPRFRRTHGMLALPTPCLGGKIEELKKHINLSADAFVLAIGWLLSVLRGRGPYPILALNGEQGAGKTTAADMLRRLVDPCTAPLRALPRDVRDLAIAANNAQVLAFDNLSGMSADIADALCRLSTGGGFATRALYSDDEERIFDGQRPVVMTSIVDVATRADLADRTLVGLLEAIADTERKTEREVREAFEAAAPFILGALLDAVAEGLKRESSVKLNRLPRMADHAVWVRACETAFAGALLREDVRDALTWKEGLHLEVYDRNRSDATEIVLESDEVAMALRRHMDARAESTTTSTELLDTLSGLVPEHVRRSKGWPPNARALSGRLRRLAPALRAIGIAMTFGREGHDRRRLISIKKEQECHASQE